MKKILLFIFLVSLITLISLITLNLRKTQPPVPSTSPSTSSSSAKRIIGFLPFWQRASIDSLNFEALDEIIYFGLRINEKGEIEMKDRNGNAEQGYTRMATTFERLALKKNDKTTLSLAIILQDNEKIEMFLQNSTAQANLIANVHELITQYSLTGINLDFEYSGIPTRETVDGYTSFVTNFVNELKTHNASLTVSADVTADAIRKSRLYDVGQLANHADFIIMMAYDFYRPSSSVAGPVAPLTGKELYEYDVTTAVSDFLTVVAREKLVLGVPYYGWDFPTESEGVGSFVEKRPDETVALSTYRRNRRLIEEENLTVFFDEESQTPYMIYRDRDTNGIRQVWFENEVSLGKKYDLVNQENLAGIAIWALGYDGSHPELWNLLQEKFRE